MILTKYQEDLIEQAVEIARIHRLVYLAMETRTGKTPVSISAAYALAREYDFDEIVFATKRAAMSGVSETFDRMLNNYPHLEEITPQIVSMDSLHHLSPKPRVLIIDEAHSFGAYPKPSLRARNLHKISADCIIIYLSATPTPESYSQIFHQLWAAHSPIVAPYKDFYAWAREFVNVKQKRIGAGRYINDYANAKKDLIMPMVDYLMVSITQEEAGFIRHEVKEKVLYCDMDVELLKPIKDLKSERFTLINDREVTAPTAASLMSKAHQIYSGTVILDDGENLKLSYHKIKKLDLILKLYNKVAIFYKYIAEREMLESYLGDRATDDAHEFEASDDLIFIGQFQSKREGINLYTADAIVFYNIDFAYVSYLQAKNRIMNMNRTKEAILIWLFTTGGIEERIYKVVKGKKNYTASYYKRQEKIKW